MAEGALADVVVRRYAPGDAGQVWRLHEEGLRDFGAWVGGDPISDADLHDIEGVYLAARSNFWVAEVDGEIIATTAVRAIDEETVELKRMRVAGAWRRRGIGRRLLELAEAFCRQEGYRRIVLDTTEAMVPAQTLYTRHGFTFQREACVSGLRILYFAKELSQG